MIDCSILLQRSIPGHTRHACLSRRPAAQSTSTRRSTNELARSATLPGGANNLAGGGTGWLVTAGNVVGGEVIKLRIAIWDTSDGNLDSLAIIDNFEWSVEASEPGTVIY